MSNIRIQSGDHGEHPAGSNRVGTADAMLVFDLVAATKNLDRAGVDRTRAIVSTGLIPTGAMVSGRASEAFPALDQYREAIEANTVDSLWLDTAGIARRQWGSQPAANVLVLGLAYQRGLLPVTGASLERAIELNGVAVATNLAAFRLGRRIAADPSLLDQLGSIDETVSAPPLDPMAAGITDDPALNEILAWRIPELVEWEDAAYARRYLAVVRRVRDAEARVVGEQTDLSQSVARHLYKFMAYKDEYEVARLALRADPEASGVSGKMSYQLKPPTMKAVGYDKKVSIPEAAGRAMFQGLLRTKRLRNTRLDPFGRTEERRTERALIGEYTELVELLITDLDAAGYDTAVEISQLADMVRGFDTVKMANVERYRAAVAERLAAR